MWLAQEGAFRASYAVGRTLRVALGVCGPVCGDGRPG